MGGSRAPGRAIVRRENSTPGSSEGEGEAVTAGRREAALQAAVVASEAAASANGHYRGTRPDELLDQRLGPLDWSRFDSPGYDLLREVARRRGLQGATRRMSHPRASEDAD